MELTIVIRSEEKWPIYGLLNWPEPAALWATADCCRVRTGGRMANNRNI